MARCYTAMDVKLAAAVTEVVNVAAFCRDQGISRSSFYKWRTRFRDEGLAGLDDRSRRPLTSRRDESNRVLPRPALPRGPTRDAQLKKASPVQ